MTCDRCPRNKRQVRLIQRLWHDRCKLKRRAEVQQSIIDRQRKPAPLTPQQRAEQTFTKGAG